MPICITNGVKISWKPGKSRLDGDIKREATTTEVHHLKNENMDLKQLVAELSLEDRMLKKTLLVPSKLQVYETKCK